MIINPYAFGGGAPASYNSIVAGMSPSLWWKLEETSGTSAADASGGGRNGSLTGGANFSTVGIAAASGLAGVGRGADLAVSSATDIRGTASPPDVLFGAGSTNSWTVVMICAGGSGSCYLASRQNDAAIIHNFVSGQVEFFAIGYTGSDPRTGSQITLSNSDTTTPHMIAYRYDNGNWAGILDGSEVFNVSRSFSLVSSHTTTYLGSDGGGTNADRKFYDFFVVNSAVPTATLAAAWAARNV